MEQNDSIKIALKERIKELNCLYEMARLAQQHHGSIEDFLKSLVDFIPTSWRYSKIACARIVFQGKAFESKKFEISEWKQSAQIRLRDVNVGNVTVFYMEECPTADEGPFLNEERSLLEAIAQGISEISIRITAQQELLEKHKLLIQESQALQEANAAMRIVLSNIEEEKRRIYENMQLNIDKLIMPLLHALTPVITKNKRQYLEILKNTLEEITSPFKSRILKHFRDLTPTEVNICYMIRNGLRTKEIADLRGVSTATINRHREHIRRKLKITNQQVNLKAYLQSLLTQELSQLTEEIK